MSGIWGDAVLFVQQNPVLVTAIGFVFVVAWSFVRIARS